jgi:citrate lyase alpha subunit
VGSILRRCVAASGGAVANAASPMIIASCYFEENGATGATGTGGAIADVASSSLSGCTFRANWAGQTGGGFYGRISRRPNQGLIDHLLACLYLFEIPPRQKDFTRPLNFEDSSES